MKEYTFKKVHWIPSPELPGEYRYESWEVPRSLGEGLYLPGQKICLLCKMATKSCTISTAEILKIGTP